MPEQNSTIYGYCAGKGIYITQHGYVILHFGTKEKIMKVTFF